ncbi:hypothetical protein [Amycolatopsis anabasis]|uniref:hypothetical protein n=1 Tax=Amycolatopsis anabasis TaxID=1840409 RepID=UPI00131E7EA6|nr:hypothetical protein [Amycolatopsis anabasis]
MRLPSVPGITPVSLRSVEATTAELAELLVRLRGADAARDPGLELAAAEAAELAHEHGAGLVAVVEHAAADPAILVAAVIGVDRPMDLDAAAELRYYLADSGGPDIREVTQARTATGYPVVIAERILVTDQLRSGPPAGAQLQAVVVDPSVPRIAVFTLHSPTGRGWLELATVIGTLVSGVDFGAVPSPAR